VTVIPKYTEQGSRAFAGALAFVGIVCIAYPCADLLLNHWPIQVGDIAWRFQFVGMMSQLLITPLIGVAFLAGAGILNQGGPFLKLGGFVSLVTGLLVLLLSAMGVYGVVALAVTNRTKEIGLRIAMGATRGGIVRGVLGDALRTAGPGLLVGGILAAGTAAAMRSMLLGISPVDPVSFLAAGVLLLIVVVASSLGPALRASGIHPMEALRNE
jgi:ABC-type antimicrobial peptide transport system permease subunit